jgi:hypothetical protein
MYQYIILLCLRVLLHLVRHYGILKESYFYSWVIVGVAMIKECRGISLAGTCMILIAMGLACAAAFSSHTLVKAAELRSVIIQAELYTNAYRAFEKFYGNAPGDYPLARAQWGDSTASGNGDGLILGWHDEEVYAWQHIALAGLSPDTRAKLDGKAIAAPVPGVSVPASRISDAGFLLASSQKPDYGRRSGNRLEFGAGGGNPSLILAYGALTGRDASAVDHKVDDGFADNGYVFAMRGVGATDCISNGEGTTVTYLTGSDATDCRLLFWLD